MKEKKLPKWGKSRSVNNVTDHGRVLGDFFMPYQAGTLSKQEDGEGNLLEAQGILVGQN